MAAGCPYAAVVATFPDAPCLGVVVAQGRLRRIDLLSPGLAGCDDVRPVPSLLDRSLLARIQTAFAAFFGSAQASALIGLPLADAPTPFAARVRRALMAIPPGWTRTYGELARELGTSARAIGMACRANPLPIVVPCHRVVAVAAPGGYAGASNGPLPDFKRALLAHEARCRSSGIAR